ncbi:Kelch repeat type 1-containing protein [Rhizobium sp. CF080]|uniref:Kelch repeat-containing protein n=1 Tax=Rhizobium sp. (strain CF080) TaxID=1144310 RepID=UPI0003E7EFBD|nr:kelch repeat-containing protein [Rhizobium sp. CF080]EUB99502.1 Kelch repeat type 1-containing protein [Rhizobium sp. CF080]
MLKGLIAAGFAVGLSAAAWAQADPALGNWGRRAPLLAPNSEFTLTSANGKIYVLGGYPAGRVSVKTVQVYDIAGDAWTRGPDLPEVNNHGMAAAYGDVIYLFGGQTDPQTAYVDAVYSLDTRQGANARWEERARMPTKRSAGAAAVHEGKIYVVGGRPPRGHDFAVYDPRTDTWERLPDLPTQRNHISAEMIDGKIHVFGGRLGGGFMSDKTAAHEVYDPATRQWTVAAPMLKPRSGINSAITYGCVHVWGGEEEAGVFPDHDIYDPRNDSWSKLPNMPIPVHGVTGATFAEGLIYVTGGGTEVGGNSGSLLNQIYRPGVKCE